MSRNVCQYCLRPDKVCICGFIKPINNNIEIGILQHPSEVKQIKGTAIIAQLSLCKVSYWVGESLDDLPGLVNWLDQDEKVYLLYPDIENQTEAYYSYSIKELTQSAMSKQGIKILVLDGTWRKTYKMMQLNSALRQLDRIELNPLNESQYKIRKQKDQQSLATIEAIYELLAQLENNPTKFQPLLDAFESIQNQQLAFRKP
ncbi:tRNA-uridine aminocarboxypropyltransferase [Thiomicrorhabdus sp.]|uniref:tRNA-uridine aminocarboxypropyltransferase n=1 Tax=Thiomicrorhabdus sp. TaxID=2039724 RepID=UPI002AA928F2|nr:tRNA-uridine aminocarboxypropyltransferase [Thiomicrorhabdus sp.]